MSTPQFQPPYQGYAQAPAPAKTNSLAIAALVSSFFISLLGVILGHIALNQIKTTGEGGRGLAIAALIIGYVSMALAVVIIVIMAAAAASYRG
jgi:TRAP-type C4-dicarboxylate transport system permease small subunit